MRLFTGAGERDIRPLSRHLTADDYVCGVCGVPLGGEWVLDVGKPQIGLLYLVMVELQASAVGEPQLELAPFTVHGRDRRAGAVAQRAVVGVVDGVPDLDLVAGVESVGTSRDRKAVLAELLVLAADRLRSRVELIQVFVRGLCDHERAPARGTVMVRGFQRLVFNVLLVGVEVHAVAGCVGADRVFDLAFAEQRLAVAVPRITGTLVVGQLNQRVRAAGAVFDLVPEPAGTDRLVLLWVADSDQPCAGCFDGPQQSELFAG